MVLIASVPGHCLHFTFDLVHVAMRAGLCLHEDGVSGDISVVVRRYSEHHI